MDKICQTTRIDIMNNVYNILLKEKGIAKEKNNEHHFETKHLKKGISIFKFHTAYTVSAFLMNFPGTQTLNFDVHESK